MTATNRKGEDRSRSLDLAFQGSGRTPADAYQVQRVVLDLTQSYFKEYWDSLPYQANEIILRSGAITPGNTGNTFLIVFNNADYAYTAPYLIIDGSTLRGGDFSGPDPFFGDAAVISLTRVTAYNAHVTTGGGNDAVSSGIGSDWISTGAGDDYASIGSGIDTVYTGAGNDYIESTYGDFTAADRIYGGAGVDEISFYAQDIHDADLVQVRSIELLGLSSNGDLELGAQAQRVGIRELFVDDTNHAITVGAAFHRTLTINMYGNFDNNVSIDASQSDAKLIVHAEYAPADLVREFHGGTGSGDTLWVSAGFSGLPVYGANLTHVTGFEHIIVDGGFDVGGFVTLATAAADINAAYQTIDASTLGEGTPLTLDATAASADLRIVGGAGADVLRSGSGDDRITGGLGGDTLKGGAGADTFLYTSVDDSSGRGIDVVKDFRSGRDTIDVTRLGSGDPDLSGQKIAFFGNVGQGGDAGFARTAGNGVLDAVFHADTHTLWFDTDDNGVLDAGDLHLVLARVDSLTGADVLAGHVLI